MENNVVERFMRYVRFNTCSDSVSGKTPSTDSQREFALILADELKAIGLVDVVVDMWSYVYATLPTNASHDTPIVGFVSHMDTSPDFTAKNVSPQFMPDYNGGEIVLNKESNIILSPEVFPELKKYIGQRLIVTNGQTLLGADDKAGIAEIITAMEYLINHPEIKHGQVKIAFTPDEEIGEGADHFNVADFGAHFAYTIDGGEIGELEYENFNASGVKIVVHGSSVHPGYAKGKMKNSVTIGNKLLSMVPNFEVPEHTDGYQGFYHVTQINGSVEQTIIEYIIRDFTLSGLNDRKNLLMSVVNMINAEFGENTAEIAIKDQYFNMREKIEPVKYIVDLAEQAMLEAGVVPKIVPIRGGTDGSRLSYMGLPCPNIFAGGHNFHGKYEYIPTPSMAKACEVIVRIVEKVGLLSN
jgi:tripeptide aminopeptidase